MVPIALLYVKNWEEECCKQKKEEFREQFRESIQTLSAILKVGYSVENAIRETWKEICPIYKKKTRIIKEYETMVHQLDLNMTAEEVMKQFADRVKEEDVENFVTVFGAENVWEETVLPLFGMRQTQSEKKWKLKEKYR